MATSTTSSFPTYLFATVRQVRVSQSEELGTCSNTERGDIGPHQQTRVIHYLFETIKAAIIELHV